MEILHKLNWLLGEYSVLASFAPNFGRKRSAGGTSTIGGQEMKRIVAVVCAMSLFAFVPSLASASTTSDAYQHQAAALSAENTNESTSAANETTLPFTGIDVAVLVIGGTCLLGFGVLVRRVSARLE